VGAGFQLEHSGTRLAALGAHVVVKTGIASGVVHQAGWGDKPAAPIAAVDEPLTFQLRQRLAKSDAGGGETLGQRALSGQFAFPLSGMLSNQVTKLFGKL
jgi:hypothetical protein